jgi:peptidyl-prolyl cis-trans isomerase D
MAVIGKIREKSMLLLIVIGVAMLAFVLGDLFKSGSQFFSDGNQIGEIDGVEITAIEFNERLEQAVTSWEMQNGGAAADAEVRASFRDQVWNEIIQEKVLGSQFTELGISVSPEELFDMVQGNDPHPQVRQAFTDPNTGVFNPTQVLQFLKSLETMPVDNRNQWLLFEDGIQKERVATKYNNLLVKGMYATNSMLKRTYKEQNEQRNLKFVVKRYNTVNDSTVDVTKEELKAYYEEHKSEYKQDESRDIEYVKFEVTPSEIDREDALKWINETLAEFKITDNDSSFVEFNSEIPFDASYLGEQEMPFGLDSSFFHSEIGTIVGPVEENGAYILTKLSKIKMVPDSVKARHILLKTAQQPTDTLLKAKLDSVKLEIENGADFAAIAKEMSEDVGSAIEGGDLGWFRAGQMVPEFNDACFDGAAGDIVIVQTQYGYHLIEVLEQSEKVKKIQLARVIRRIIPSNETFDAVFAQASAFYSSNSTTEAFKKATETDKFTKFLAPEVKVADKNVQGLQNVREMVRWAFNNEKGSVSAPFQFENIFVVAHLSEVREDGTATMEQVEIQVELGAKKKKKAAQFIEEMKGATSLDDLATKINGKVETAPNVNFAAYAIPGMGQELRVNGMASTLKQGEMSIPIEGQTGVFVIMVESVTPAAEVTDYSAIKTQMEQSYAGLSGIAFEALKNKFEVVDKRYKFY